TSPEVLRTAIWGAHPLSVQTKKKTNECIYITVSWQRDIRFPEQAFADRTTRSGQNRGRGSPAELLGTASGSRGCLCDPADARGWRIVERDRTSNWPSEG